MPICLISSSAFERLQLLSLLLFLSEMVIQFLLRSLFCSRAPDNPIFFCLGRSITELQIWALARSLSQEWPAFLALLQVLKFFYLLPIILPFQILHLQGCILCEFQGCMKWCWGWNGIKWPESASFVLNTESWLIPDSLMWQTGIVHFCLFFLHRFHILNCA